MSNKEEIQEFLSFVNDVWSSARENEEGLIPLEDLIRIFNNDEWCEVHRLYKTGREYHNITLDEVEHLICLM